MNVKKINYMLIEGENRSVISGTDDDDDDNQAGELWVYFMILCQINK